jgi:hypothetical protein
MSSTTSITAVVLIILKYPTLAEVALHRTPVAVRTYTKFRTSYNCIEF